MEFNEGVAIVATKDGDDYKFSVIDKSGNTLFKIKEDYIPQSLTFKDDRLLLKSDDNYAFVDKKGEMEKLPAKYGDISDYNSKYIIFQKRGEREYGVADMESEVIIRAKYKRIQFAGSDKFLCMKDDDTEVLDAKGETVLTLDGEEAFYAGEYGYFVRDGNTFELTDNDGKTKLKDDIYRLGDFKSRRHDVNSDYFDYNAIAEKMFDHAVGEEKHCTIGTDAVQIFGNIEPDYTYTYQNSFEMPIAGASGRQYSLNLEETFDLCPATSTYDSSNWKNIYRWNPNSKLIGYSVKLSTSHEWGKEGYDAIVKVMKANGYKELTSSEFSDGNYETVFNNDKYTITVKSGNDFASLSVALQDGTAIPAIASSGQQPAEAVSTPAADSRDFVSLVTTRKLTAADLKGYTKAELRLMRNTIYALHGRIFKSNDLKQYFSQFSWYKPSVTEISKGSLSPIEVANLDLIQKYE